MPASIRFGFECSQSGKELPRLVQAIVLKQIFLPAHKILATVSWNGSHIHRRSVTDRKFRFIVNIECYSWRTLVIRLQAVTALNSVWMSLFRNRSIAAVNFAAVIALLLFIFAFFAQPIVTGLPISKIFLLANRDLLFSQFRDLEHAIRWDPSLFQLAVPNFFTVAESWRHGNIPLWTPYVGLGMPLVGDLQSCIFSPWRILGSLSPTISFYNFQLILQICFCAIGCFFLSRFLKLGVIASLLVSVLYALGPHQLSFLELLNGPAFTLFPWLLFAFARAAEKQTLIRLTVAAALTALTIFTGHTLVAFGGILTASFLFLGFSIFAYGQSSERLKTAGVAFLTLSGIALISFVFSSPILLPFAEFMQNCVCYKFSTEQDVLPWQTMPYFLLHPAVGAASPYLGVLAVPLVVAGYFVQDSERTKYGVILAAIAVLYVLMGSLGPMAIIATATPLRFVPGHYYIFVTLLLLSILAGYGVDAIASGALRQKKALFAVLASVAVTLAVPLIIKLLKLDLSPVTFDDQLGEAEFRVLVFVRDSVLALLFCILAICSQWKNLAEVLSPKVLSVCAAMLCLLSELLVSSSSLPIRPSFDFVETEVHKFLQQVKGRVAPIGFDVLVANANAVYGIRSMAIHNPLFGKRFFSFVEAAEMHADYFNIMLNKYSVSKLTDLCNLTYILSVSPTISADEKLQEETTVENTKEVLFTNGAEDVILKRSKVAYSEEKQEVLGSLEWQLPAARNEEDAKKIRARFSYVAVITDKSGNSKWFGPQTPCVATLGKKKLKSIFNFESLVPCELKPGSEFSSGLRVFDNEKVQFLQLSNTPNKLDTPHHLGSWVVSERKNTNSGRFSLEKESGPHRVRIYKNKTALPQAYFVSRIETAKDAQSVMDKLRAPEFVPRQSAIVEIDPATGRQEDTDFCHWFEAKETLPEGDRKILSELLQPNTLPTQANDPEPLVLRPSPNEVSVKTKTSSSAFLVLTDQFYPGWHAYIDGKETPIYCTNYLMRGVFLPAGDHQIEFKFRPRSFWLGVNSVFVLLAILSLAHFVARQKRKSKGAETPG